VNGTKPSAAQILASADTTYGSGSAAPAPKASSKPSSEPPASTSRGRPHKRTIARAKTTIAIALEQIDSQLLILTPADRIMALVEAIRRMTRRLETEGAKILEQLDAK
jgi:hypothetical protein